MGTKPDNAAIVALRKELGKLNDQYEEVGSSLYDAEEEVAQVQTRLAEIIETRNSVLGELKQINLAQCEIMMALSILDSEHAE